LTISDYLLVRKAVRVAELKARLSEYLRLVRPGEEVAVVDRETPVARIVLYKRESWVAARQPSPDSPLLHQIPLPRPLRIDADVVALLLEERQRGR